MQTLIVALLVAGCALYAVWTLMPAALRRPAASALLVLPLPGRLRTKVEKAAARTAGGCGCDGCDHAARPAATSAGAAHPITFHPRNRR